MSSRREAGRRREIAWVDGFKFGKRTGLASDQSTWTRLKQERKRYANRRLVKNDSRLTRLLLRHRPYADSVRAIRRARTLVRPSSAVASGSTKLSRGRPCSSCSTKSLKLCFRVAAKELAADFDP